MANKYLDLTGVGELWKLIRGADDKVKTDLETIINGIKATSGATIARQNGDIVLKNADGTIISYFSESDFVKDGVLQSVEIITVKEDESFMYDGALVKKGEKFIKFTWNTDAGAGAGDGTGDGTGDKDNVPNVTYLKVSEIAPVYTGTGGVVVNDDNQITIEKVDATKTTLSKDIEVKGGPLADDNTDWPEEWKKDGKVIIPANASLEDILTNLFLKKIDGTVSFGNVSWSPAVNKPTVTLSETDTVEVGTKVKVTKLSKGTFNEAKRSVTLTTTYGYFDGDTYYSATSVVFYSAKSSATGTETLTCKWNNEDIDIAVNETELTTVEGTNTLAAAQSGLVATVSAIPSKTVYASTNIKTKLTDPTTTKKQIASISEKESTYTSGTLTNSKNATVTAYYPIYTNGKTGTHAVASTQTSHVADDATKLPLMEDGTIFYVDFAPMIKDGGTGYRLLVQKDKKITHAMALNPNNYQYVIDMKNDFIKAAGTVTKKSGGVDTEYVVYEAKGTQGANNIQIKID